MDIQTFAYGLKKTVALPPSEAEARVRAELEEDIGLLLPCNLVVYEGESESTSVVAVLDPVIQLSVTGREDIEPLAREVADRLRRVLERI